MTCDIAWNLLSVLFLTFFELAGKLNKWEKYADVLF